MRYPISFEFSSLVLLKKKKKEEEEEKKAFSDIKINTVK